MTKISKMDGVSGRSDVYSVDPRVIYVKEGWNPRTDFAGEEELRDSIIQNGVKIPLRVREDDEGDIVLIDGERRLRATMRAIDEGFDIKSVPCIFEKSDINEVDALVLAIIANDGKPFDPLEEAEAYQRFVNWGFTVDEIAKKIGRSNVSIYEKLALMSASPEVKEALKSKEITVREAAKISKKNSTVSGQSEEVKKVIERKKIKKCCQTCENDSCAGLHKIIPDADVRKDYCTRYVNQYM